MYYYVFRIIYVLLADIRNNDNLKIFLFFRILGETSLHLAARYARADASKRLLDAGAEVNLQDNTGRTPLHAAVAADAMGVFQVFIQTLLRILYTVS